jgi:methylglyoxal synthase
MDAPVAVVTPSKRIALVAHDNKKADLLEWAQYNRDLLASHELLATGTTGTLLEEALQIPVIKLQSGPLGGDQQVGARIAEGTVDLVIFFWDPLQPQPHDPDVKALLRIAVVWNIPVACNRASADYMISSPLLSSAYERQHPEYEAYRNRMVKVADAANDALPAVAPSGLDVGPEFTPA